MLDGKDAKSLFASLEARREEIEPQIGLPLTWHNPGGKNMCRIYVRKDSDFLDPQHWPEQLAWLKENVERFAKVFGPILKTL